MRFDGRSALITGAGKGLGRAYAVWLAARGARVVVNNRVHANVPSSAQAVVAEIIAAGGEAVADDHNVETEAGARAMVETAITAFGGLDILICNAAISLVNTPFTELTSSQFQEILAVNVWGTFYPLHAALPGMIAAGHGRVVLTTSHIALYGRPGSSAYGCSKAAVLGLARSVAHDVAAYDIEINVIAPGAYTQLSNALGPEFAETASAQKVAPVVGWMCSAACRESGMILCAGGGRVRRARIMEGDALEVTEANATEVIPGLSEMSCAVEAPNAASSGQILIPGERR